MSEDMQESSYKDELWIDQNALDEEWLQQSNLYMKYAELHARAIRRRDRAWEKTKVVRSELIKEAKSGQVEELGAKPTDPTVEAYYRSHKRHIDAKDDQIEAEFEVNIYSAAVFAFQQRKVALENLVRLGMGDYFAMPRVPRDISGFDPKKDRRNQRSQKEREKMRRTA
jgi:hypothetical protein